MNTTTEPGDGSDTRRPTPPDTRRWPEPDNRFPAPSRPGEPGELIDLPSTSNLRDLGGYPTVDGRRVVPSRVFRSDRLSGLDDSGVAILARLGIGTAIDLRYPEERAEAPNRLPDGARLVATCTVARGDAMAAGFLDLVISRQVTSYTFDDFEREYRRFPNEQAVSIVRTLETLADGDERGAVIHCTAGKDRTGMVCGVLLLLLGVGEADVMHDYLLTNTYRSALRVAEVRSTLDAHGIEIEHFRAMFEVAPRLLQATLEEIDRRGGIERYLLDHGLDPEIPAHLRGTLVR